MTSEQCPFCRSITEHDVVFENKLAVVLEDFYPVNPGHMLVVPRRHEGDFIALTFQEQCSMMELMRDAVWALRDGRDAEGFTIGVNAGEVAGQTIDHAHMHIIPRYRGDVPDPRGGVRWVVPDRAKYWPE